MTRSGVRRASLAAALVTVLSIPCPARAEDFGPDSLRLRFEVGAGVDLTNEQFYEDAFVDSITLGRKLVNTPEHRYAAIVATSLTGTRSERATSYQLRNEASIGDKIQRDVLGLAWRTEFASGWRLSLTPSAEYRHDKSFEEELGRNLQEWRGNATARLRHGLGLGWTFMEFAAGGDFLRTSGPGAGFLLDRNAGRASVALDRAPLLGADWRIEYGLAARAFPDSSVRDHLEHQWDARWRHEFMDGSHLQIESTGARRVAMKNPPTSRDEFWQAEGAIDAAIGGIDSRSLRARVSLEGLHYDQEDEVIYFDYQILRTQIGPRWQRGRQSLGLGPRAETLFSRRNVTERYQEIGGWLEWEFLGGTAWWTVTPSAGWRDYAEPAASDTVDAESAHSSFAFYEVGVLGDQPIPGSLRVRVFATARYESHIDAAQNARSLYFSLDVRRLF